MSVTSRHASLKKHTTGFVVKRRWARWRMLLRERVVFVLTLLLVFLLPFPLGSNRIWAWGAEAVVAGTLLLAYLALCDAACWQRLRHRLRSIRLLLWLMLGWLLWNGLFVLSLPSEWVAVLAPAVARQAAESGVAATGLSLDRYASLVYWLQSIFYITFFVLVFVQIHSFRRVQALVWTIFLAALVQAIYGLWLVSIGSRGLVYGFYEVSAHNLAASFVNRNHAVAYLALGLLSGVAVRIWWAAVVKLSRPVATPWRQRQNLLLRAIRFFAQPKRVVDLALLVLLAGLAATHSRAGVGSALVSIAVLLACRFVRPRRQAARIMPDNNRQAKSMTTETPQPLFRWRKWLIIGLIAGLFTGSELRETGQRFMTPEGSPLAGERWLALQQGREYLDRYLPWGVGGGAYASFFVMHRQAGQTHFFDHAHNDYLEFLVENGLGVLFVLGMLIWIGSRAWRACRSESPSVYAAGALVLAVMVYFLLHGLWDFNARIPANVLTGIALVAAFLGIRSTAPPFKDTKEAGQSVTK